jgi:hypothetical protein
MNRHRFLIALGVALAVTMAASAFFARNAARDGSLLAWLLAFLPYFAAIFAAKSVENFGRAALGFAILLRVVALFAPEDDDVYRYLWEGKIQRAGYNPYVVAPQSAQLAPLRDEIWKKINHPDVPTIYPPLAQLVFRGVAATKYDPLTLKLLLAALDIATCWLLLQLFAPKNLWRALIYAWNPLVVVEFAGHGHIVGMAVFFFVLMLWLARDPANAGREPWAGVAAAASAASHLLVLPLIWVILLRKNWRMGVIFAVTLLILAAPFAEAGAKLLGGATHFAGRWRFNDSIFGLLVKIFGETSPKLVGENVWATHFYAKIVSVLVVGAVFLLAWRRKFEWSRACGWVFGAMILMSPTVHAWYVTPLVAVLCWWPSRAWLLFTATVTASYVTKVVSLETAVWLEFPVARAMVYAPFFAALAVDALTLWRNSDTLNEVADEKFL